MTELRISLIIPTHNRIESLRRTLDSLAQQSYPADCYEVIVVDDGSTDDTPTIANEHYPFQLYYIRQANQGAAVARNRGVEAAQGEVLIFLDDDITVVPEFVSNMAHAADGRRTIMVGTLHLMVRPDASPFEQIYVQPKIPPGMSSDGEIPFADVLFGIFSIRRDAFFEIGEVQDISQGDRAAWCDVDFGYRAHRLGYCFRRCSGAVGYHHDSSVRNFYAFCQKWDRASRSAVLLFQKYPDLQPHIPMFHDKNPISLCHDSPRLVLRKVGRALTAWRPVLWGMEQLVHMLEQFAPRPELLLPLYRWTVSSYIYRGYRQGLREYGPVPMEGQR